MTAASPTNPRLLTPNRPRANRPLFVFLPGMDGTGELLQPQIGGLEECFDIRCLSLPADDCSDWSTLAAQTSALVRQERQSERPIVLCGESFGGCLALLVALTAPQLCDRLILVNPASSFGERPHLKLAMAVLPWLPDSFYRSLAGTILPLLTANRPIEPAVREALVIAMQSVPPKTAGWRLTLLENFQMAPSQLRRLTCPTLLIAGESDRLLPSTTEVERLAAALPDARTVTLPESGHACLLETDVHLFEILRRQEFLPNTDTGDAGQWQNVEKMR